MKILIPAYEPNLKMIKLIQDLQKITNEQIIIVDDSSGPEFQSIFTKASSLGCHVIVHSENSGKGAALKTGFRYLKAIGETDGVVCADCDGQHLPKDILSVAEETKQLHDVIILGGRKFDGKVPMRSKFGNTVTKYVFRFLTGIDIQDTQTGLRGYSASLFDFLLSVPGDRFEYEMNLLVAAHSKDIPMTELAIKTIYSETNHSSHFRTFQDSARVYWPLLKFSATSLLSAAIDLVLLLVLSLFTTNLLLSVVVARLCSATFNYTMNNKYIFNTNRKVKTSQSLPRYILLAVVILVANYYLISFFNLTVGMPLTIAKITTEIALCIFSFCAQRLLVFQIKKNQVKAHRQVTTKEERLIS